MINKTLATVVSVIATMYATKPRDIAKPYAIPGWPDFLMLYKAFFLCLKNKKKIRVEEKKKALQNKICQISAFSISLTSKPPQLKKKAPIRISV